MYNCVDCETNRYIIFPKGDESLVICSACYMIRKEKEEEKKKEVLQTQPKKYRVFH